MTYQLSQQSINKLKGVHKDLVKVILTAIKTSPIDFTVLEGLRTDLRQQQLFKSGASKCDGIKKKSKHQKQSDGYSHAIDVVPVPINWKDRVAFKILSTHIKNTAKKLGVNIRWGGDFKTFIDMPHYQLET